MACQQEMPAPPSGACDCAALATHSSLPQGTHRTRSPRAVARLRGVGVVQLFVWELLNDLLRA